MSSTVTTVVSSVISNQAYAATFGLFVALALIGMLVVVEVGTGVRSAAAQRLLRSSTVATVPFLIAFAAIAATRVLDVLQS